MPIAKLEKLKTKGNSTKSISNFQTDLARYYLLCRQNIDFQSKIPENENFFEIVQIENPPYLDYLPVFTEIIAHEFLTFLIQFFNFRFECQ